MRFWFGKGVWASKSAKKLIREIDPEQVKSIAIIRHAALGDMILTRPFIYECRKFFPNARITLSVASNYTRGAPVDLVDRVHTIIGSDQRDVPRVKQREVMRELGYHDLIFDLAVTTRSLWTITLNKAKLKIGFPYHSYHRIFFDVTAPRSDLRFEAEGMLDLLNLMGVKTSMPLNFALDIQPEKQQRPYVVYFTSASTDYKCWPDENFSELIDSMSRRYPDMNHIVLEGVGEHESVQNIIGRISDRENVSAANRDTVDETLSFVAGASLVVSNDTSIRHLAIATGTPSIGIFAIITEIPAAPFRYWPRFGKHEIAMNIDGSWPDAKSVEALATELLSKSE